MRFSRLFLSAFILLLITSACSNRSDPDFLLPTATNPVVSEPEVSNETAMPFELQGPCDASAAVSIAPGTFIMANDEDNILRVYQPVISQAPLYAFDVSSFLAVTEKNPEADIEGATRIDNKIFWITSHGTNKDGKARPNRHRFFATEVRVAGGQVTIVPIGKPYANLVHDLSSSPALKRYKLDLAATKSPEEPDSLNIEGLAATPEGSLLIAFRTPNPEGKTLIIPLENPLDVVQRDAKAQFGEPILLEMGGRGIRSIEYSEFHGQYFMIAGPHGEDGDLKLYQWKGILSDAPLVIDHIQFSGLQPEAIVIYQDERNKIQILSDDGAKSLEGVDCKDAPLALQRFSSLWVSP